MARDILVGPEHFSGIFPALGSCRLAVGIGPISVAFDGLPDFVFEDLRARYQPFLHDGPVLEEVRVHAGEASYLAPGSDGFLRVQDQVLPEGALLLSEDFAAFRPAGGGRGVLRISGPTRERYAAAAVENYLRWAVADLALGAQGFIMHTAGLVRGGEARLFFGHSGAGKSTVCSLSPEAPLLSDDLVLILREGDRFKASTTPFQGTLAQGAKEKGLYPVRGAYRLRQSSMVRTAAVSPAMAVGLVLGCCPFVSSPDLRSRALLPLVESFCRAVPVRELHFRKDSSFWDVILEEEGA